MKLTEMVYVMIGMCGVACPQGQTPHFLFFAADGERLTRYIPEISTYRDSTITGLHHISAIQYNDADSAFYVVDRGDSAGHDCGMILFPATECLRQTIGRVDTIRFEDSTAPADVLFLSPTRAYVSMSGRNRIDVWNPLSRGVDNTIALPGSPGQFVRLSLSRTLVICAGSHDSSHLVMLNTDGDSIAATLSIPGLARHGVRDRNFRAHVLSRQMDGTSRVVVVDQTLTVDTTYRFAGDFSWISTTAHVDTAYERVLLSHWVLDSLVQQYNPLTRQIFPRIGPRASIGVGFGGEIFALEPDALTECGVSVGGSYTVNSHILIPPVKQFTAVLDVTPVSLSVGVRGERPSPAPLSVSVYPQPCVSQSEITVEAGADAMIRVSDELGRRVASLLPITPARWHLDAAHIPAGVYYLHAWNAGGTVSRPLLIIR